MINSGPNFPLFLIFSLKQQAIKLITQTFLLFQKGAGNVPKLLSGLHFLKEEITDEMKQKLGLSEVYLNKTRSKQD